MRKSNDKPTNKNNNSDYNIEQIINSMVDNLQRHLDTKHIEKPLIVGIHTTGVWLAKVLHKRLTLPDTIGELNVNFYRDDFNQNGLPPQILPSQLPFTIEDRHIILVDDVLFTGRTIRAAMNELYDYGRPASIILAILFEREGRELPIAADISGIRQDLSSDQYIQLTGPENMELSIIKKP